MTRLQVETDLRHAIDERASRCTTSRSSRCDPAASPGSKRWCAGGIRCAGLCRRSDFIGVAEDTGMIVDIGRLTLAESCRQMAAWLRTFGAAAPEVMCVNVSSRQLADADLMREIAAMLQATG